MKPKPEIDPEELAELREIFDHFDKDHSGSIDMVELGQLMDALGGHAKFSELVLALSALDTDHSGRIDFDEFVAWWRDR